MTHLEPSLRQRVTQARVARLATVSPAGGPHIVPITFAVDGDTIVTAVDHKPKTTTRLQRLENIEAHPVASVIIDHYDDDWSRLWWVRGDGDARIVFEGGDHEQAISRLADKYEQYRRRRPDGPVIVVAVTRWASWSSEQAEL
ncbi:MAG TPA: TIGR03668 family PPOX class F420-dependent oxidoreductase [Acidimicrobiales bacterium]|nr:TIGR03668 family PPOX class F420-dependent oxidoreductase [Acidimicrobiales bacterium]